MSTKQPKDRRAGKAHLSPMSAPLSGKEVTKLLAAISADPKLLKLLLMVNLLLYTGARASELISLAWTDVDPVQHRFALNSRSGSRWVRITPEIQILLEAMKGQPTQYIFGDDDSRAVFSRICVQLTRVADQLGMPITFHRLRKTALMRMRLSGVSEATIMTIAGLRNSIVERYSVRNSQLAREGSLYCQGGEWWMKFYVGGHMVRECCYTQTKHVALALLRKRLCDPENN